MPMFEFVCSQCERSFEELVRSTGDVGEIACPACGSREVKKKISTFASKISGGSSFSANTATSASCSTGST